MLRSVGIALIVSLMVADPYLCASAEAGTDCPDSEPGASCEHHPDEPAGDECYSCLCRGATASRDQHEMVSVSCLSAVVEPLLLPTVFVVDYYTYVRHTNRGHPLIGQRVRILLESYLA